MRVFTACEHRLSSQVNMTQQITGVEFNVDIFSNVTGLGHSGDDRWLLDFFGRLLLAIVGVLVLLGMMP